MTHFLSLTLAQRLDRFPPCLCFALARVTAPSMTKEEITARRQLLAVQDPAEREDLRPKRHRRLTVKEFSELSGLSQWKVRRMSRSRSWAQWTVREMIAFVETCRVELCHAAMVNRAMKRFTSKTLPFGYLHPEQRKGLIYQLSKQGEKLHDPKRVENWKRFQYSYGRIKTATPAPASPTG